MHETQMKEDNATCPHGVLILCHYADEETEAQGG